MLKITNPITGAELQVANQDFSDALSWEKAKRASSELGSGWRLPTKEELKAMYEQLHKKGQGNFKETDYWSSTESDYDEAWYFNFRRGDAEFFSKNISMEARAVRAF